MTLLKIICKDSSFRIIKTIGNYTSQMALILAKDLERDNFLKVEILNKNK